MSVEAVDLLVPYAAQVDYDVRFEGRRLLEAIFVVQEDGIAFDGRDRRENGWDDNHVRRILYEDSGIAVVGMVVIRS